MSYEWSRVNLTRALRHRVKDSKCPEETGSGPTFCLNDYASYVGDYGEQIDRALRVTVSAELAETDARSVDLSAIELDPLTFDRVKHQIYSLAVGGNLRQPVGDGEPPRLDFEFRYEDLSDDPTKQDRGIATLTLSKKIGKLTLPVSLVYANHSEFIGEPDHQLGAHVGLNLDFLRQLGN